MGKCTKCGTNFVGTPENPPMDGLCRYCQISALTDALDMQRDDFKRIAAMLEHSDDSRNEEVVGICERAIQNIEQTVPVVIQRDNLETQKNTLRRALVGLVGADGSELEGMEAALRMAPMPDEDRMHTINAIHALRDTMTPFTIGRKE